jgi:hypothetical protein
VSTYRELLLSPRWQQTRLRIFERDAWTCQMCGRRNRTLHCHHAAYDPAQAREPWNTADDLLVTLCADCHDAEHEAHRHLVFLTLLALGQCGIRTSADLSLLIANLFVDGIEQKMQPAHALARAVSNFEGVKRERIEASDWYEIPPGIDE